MIQVSVAQQDCNNIHFPNKTSLTEVLDLLTLWFDSVSN